MCNKALARGGILLEGVAIGETPREAAAGDPSAYAEALLKVWDRALKLF